jgi:hypothetical protein
MFLFVFVVDFFVFLLICFETGFECRIDASNALRNDLLE